jgi:hypothetical protein
MLSRPSKGSVAQLFNDLEFTTTDPDSWVRITVMQWVSEYIYASYFMSINPLRNLRKVLPQYNWVFHEKLNYGAAARVARQSDFIWCSNAFGAEDPGIYSVREEGIELVTATLRQKREPLRLFYAGEKKVSSGDKPTFLMKLAEDCGAEPEYWVTDDTFSRKT